MEELGYSTLSLRDFFHVIFKRKKQILLFFLITSLAVAIGTFAVQPTYEAKIQILVKLGKESVYIPQSGRDNPIISVDIENQINSEIELLKNRSLTEIVIKSLGPKTIYKDFDHTKTVLAFQKSLSITRIKGSNVIAVGFKHKDPKLAATVVNTFANAYLEQHLKVHKNPKSVDFFEEQSKILKSNLKQVEERLKSFKEQHNVTDLDEEQRILLKQISDLRAELDRTLSQEIETKNQIRPLRPHEETLVELELKEKDLITKYTPNSRLVRNVREEIKMVRNNILFRNQAEHKAIDAKKETQIKQLAYYQNKLEKLNRIKVKLDQLQMAVDVDRQNYLLYLTKFEEARISDAMDNKKISSVSLIEPALPPLKPVFPKVLLNVFLGIVLSVFGGLGLAFFTEYLDNSLEKPNDVEQVLQLPVLASIPELKMKG
jgi:uncharacterized protein involved in exopolysaccharide biosynthesis